MVTPNWCNSKNSGNITGISTGSHRLYDLLDQKTANMNRVPPTQTCKREVHNFSTPIITALNARRTATKTPRSGWREQLAGVAGRHKSHHLALGIAHGERHEGANRCGGGIAKYCSNLLNAAPSDPSAGEPPTGCRTFPGRFPDSARCRRRFRSACHRKASGPRNEWHTGRWRP
jgi:hypothetical protein